MNDHIAQRVSQELKIAPSSRGSGSVLLEQDAHPFPLSPGTGRKPRAPSMTEAIYCHKGALCQARRT